jgi:hypothetical protein
MRIIPMLNKSTRRALVKASLKSTDGRFIGVTFTKKDGSERRLNVQPLVMGKWPKSANPKAVAAALARQKKQPHLIPVYDVRDGVRSLNLDTVKSIRLDHGELRFS